MGRVNLSLNGGSVFFEDHRKDCADHSISNFSVYLKKLNYEYCWIKSNFNGNAM